jgi:predicted AlkP superfamily phosphohydrolase/phosphomutase
VTIRARSFPVAVAALLGLAVLLVPSVAHAYVGPGAGIAIATTALALLVSVIVVVLGLLFWPLRFAYRLATRKRPPNPAKAQRAVIIGLDGLDPKLTRRFMDEGKLPNLERIAKAGGFRELGTTFPAMSPVAWSSFATGVNPAKHGIFDFLTRDPRSYQPDLSSTEIHPARRNLEIGGFKIPLGKPEIKLLRRSKPFWETLGRYQIPCSVLRVPITFPPQKYEGTLLSAMCVPDLQGSQGTFTYLTSEPDDDQASIGGQRVVVEPDGGAIEAALPGPPNPIRKDGRRVSAPISIELAGDGATLRAGREKVSLTVGEYTDWVPVAFKLGLGLKMRGICRFRLLSLDPFRLYVTPINIDPERPILPISHPKTFATFLAKLNGRFATLGLAEDTWALNEGVLDEDAFLEQAWANHAERESMFFDMLARTPKGLVTCVFDGTDRIQHMFMRYLEPDHPANRGKPEADRYKDVIPDTYARMDEMVGRVLDQVDIADPNNFVAVISDHGFESFRRGINLNSWLMERGYLVLEDGRDASGEWFDGVDWERTRAFALGLGGIFLNVRGREKSGTVEPDEARALARTIADELSGLIDPEIGEVAIRKVYPAGDIFKGPYADQAPDLVVGYSAGWRASWDGVRGIADGTVFDDNTKAWSGDHCIDPELVPGVLIANRDLGGDGDRPEISDMAPTVLDLFGIPAPRYMDGTVLAGGAP